MRQKIKERIYKLIATSGIIMLSKLFPEYFAAEPLRPTDRYIEYPFILRNLPKENKEKIKVLDVGCSGSMFPLIIKALDYEVHGIDIRNYYPEGKFFFTRGDIGYNLFKNETFDVVTAISTIEHIGLKGTYGQSETLDGDLKALNEMYRILKKNGKLLMTVPFGENLRIELNHKIYDRKRINLLLHKFEKFDIELVQSPEAEYKIALIKASK